MKWYVSGVVVLFLSVGLILSTVLPSKSGFFTGKTHNPDAMWNIASDGKNLRVYEFTPQSAGNMTCVFVAGSQKAGLDCFPKGVK